MKKLLSATVAFSLLASAGIASAQPYDRDGRGQVERGYSDARVYDRHDERRDRDNDRGYNDRGYNDHRRGDHRFEGGRYQRPAGYQHRTWRRGDRLPASYRSAHYRVDYHRYGLRAPPRGYQYMRVDNDVVLAAVATGVIVSIIAGAYN